MDKSKKTIRNLIGQHWGLDDDGNSILHVAAATGRLDLLQYFYLDRTHRSDINAQNFMGWTPLMQAARFGHFNCVEFLCQYVDIFKRNKYGLTALSLACAHGDLKSVQLLFECMLRSGCNLNEFENPVSPLTLSVLFERTELVQFFLTKSFNIFHQTIRTEITTFDCAKIVRNKQIMALLQNSQRCNSNENYFISSTLNNNSEKIPRISISNSKNRNNSDLTNSLSSVDLLSPISPVFLMNETFIKRAKSDIKINRTTPVKSPDGYDIKNTIIRAKSNDNITHLAPSDNTIRISPNKQKYTSSKLRNNSEVLPVSISKCLQQSTSNEPISIKRYGSGIDGSCSSVDISPISPVFLEDEMQPTDEKLLNENHKSRKYLSPNSLACTQNKSKRLISNEYLNRKIPQESREYNTLNGKSRTKQIFFPHDFEIPNQSASCDNIKYTSPNENMQRLTSNPISAGNNKTKQIFFPNDFEVSVRSADRLFPMVPNNMIKSSVSKSVSPKDMCKQTVIAQKKFTTTRSPDGNVLQQVTNTYVIQQTSQRSKSKYQCGDKMVNTNSNLQFNSKIILNFDSKKYKYQNESVYKMITILQTNGLGKLIPLFISEEIDYEIFLTLSLQDIIDIGVTSPDDQQKILNIITHLLID